MLGAARVVASVRAFTVGGSIPDAPALTPRWCRQSSVSGDIQRRGVTSVCLERAAQVLDTTIAKLPPEQQSAAVANPRRWTCQQRERAALPVHRRAAEVARAHDLGPAGTTAGSRAVNAWFVPGDASSGSCIGEIGPKSVVACQAGGQHDAVYAAAVEQEDCEDAHAKVCQHQQVKSRLTKPALRSMCWRRGSVA